MLLAKERLFALQKVRSSETSRIILRYVTYFVGHIQWIMRKFCSDIFPSVGWVVGGMTAGYNYYFLNNAAGKMKKYNVEAAHANM